MHFANRYKLYAALGGVALISLACAQPPTRPVATFIALNATDFRWNAPLYWMALAYALGDLLGHLTLAKAPTLASLGLLGYLVCGYAEQTASVSLSSDGLLWASPLHLLLAGTLPISLLTLSMFSGLLRFPVRKPSSTMSLVALGLACLGLLWNFYQTSAAEGWAWDWIESGPCWALCGVALASHLWAGSRTQALAAYLAFLSLSRTALLTSAHHLQSPQNTLSLDLSAALNGAPFSSTQLAQSFVGGVWLNPETLLLAALGGAVAWLNRQTAAPSSISYGCYAKTQRSYPGGTLWFISIWTTSFVAVGYPTLILAAALPLILRSAPSARYLHLGFLFFFIAGLPVVWYAYTKSSHTNPTLTSPGAMALITAQGLRYLAEYPGFLAAATWYTLHLRRGSRVMVPNQARWWYVIICSLSCVILTSSNAELVGKVYSAQARTP